MSNLRKKSATDKALEKAAAIMAEMGVKALVDIETAKKAAYIAKIEKSRTESLEGVLISLQRPHAVIYRKCKHCDELFGTNYRFTAYCGNNCRIKDFEESTGMQWTRNKSEEERWGGEPPLTIDPAMVSRMLEFASTIISAAEEFNITIPVAKKWVSSTDQKHPKGQFDDSFVQEELNYETPFPAYVPDTLQQSLDAGVFQAVSQFSTISRRPPFVLKDLSVS
jgi:hypothetical protein